MQTVKKGTTIAHIGIAVAVARRQRVVLPRRARLARRSDRRRRRREDRRRRRRRSLVELLEAEAPGSPIEKFIAKRGPGIHHVCFAVDDLDADARPLPRRGIRLIDETPRLGAEGKRIAFLHPSSTSGVLVELTEH